jgi:hypothetical protein
VFDLDDNLALLARTPATLDALLRSLPEGWTSANEGRDSWNARTVVAHLASLEADWISRAKFILETGDKEPFKPVNRNAFEAQRPLPELLDDFARLRSGNLQQVRSWKLSPDDVNRRGLHPSLGPVTLAQLLAAWAVHDLTHLHQISRVLAHQYREDVGPWRRYLGVLHCDGHGASD